MTKEAIRDALQRRPFRPFGLRLSDGTLVRIVHQNRAAVHPDAKTMIIFEPDGGYRILDIDLLTELQTA